MALADIDRFQGQRASDLRETLVSYAFLQLKTAKKVLLVHWFDFLGCLQNFDSRVCKLGLKLGIVCKIFDMLWVIFSSNFWKCFRYKFENGTWLMHSVVDNFELFKCLF